jgi:hypothetical protein
MTRRFWPAGAFRQCALLGPVNVELALRKQPRALRFHEDVVIPESGNHQALFSVSNREVMGHAIGFPCASGAAQRYDRKVKRLLGWKQGASLPQMWPGDTRYTISLHTRGKYHD